MPYDLRPLTLRQQRREAAAILRAALAPGYQEIARARADARRQAREAQAREEGLARAVAQLSQGVGPATAAGYRSAAETQGALAKGFSDAIRAGMETDANAAAAVLARLGAPEAQQQQVRQVGQGAGDVTYGLGGAIPGTAWAREGAALAAAQNQLPATALGRGQQAVGQLQRALTERERELDRQLAEIKARAPDLLAQALREIRQGEQAKAATAIQAEYLGIAGDKANLDYRSTVADITGIDPATGLPTADVQVGAQKAAGKRQAARQKAIKAREDAFASTRSDIFNEAQRLAKGENVPDPETKGLTDKVVRPSYRSAREALFSEYGPPLLRYASGAGKSALKRRIYKIIDTALRQHGFARAKKPRKANPKTRRYPGERPG